MTKLTSASIILALALVLAACGGDSDDDSTTSESVDQTTDDDTTDTTDDGQGDDPAAAEPGRAGELAIVSIDFDSGQVELTNLSDRELDLDDYVMCNFPDYAPITGGGPIGPGETVTVDASIGITAADGEIGIYTEQDFTNPEAIVAYVEWGSDGHTRAEVAVAAGIWDGSSLTPDGSVLSVG